jgi:hypothetical protein
MKTRQIWRSCLAVLLFLSICLLQARAQMDPLPSLPSPLDSWSFSDNVGWTDDNGNPPISFTNIAWTDLGNGSSLVVETNVPAWLNYPIYGTNGMTNIVVNGAGSVCFWYAGDWATTNNGPGNPAQLIEAGEADSSIGYFGLSIDSVGSNLWFASQDGVGDTYSLSAPISWTTNYFHFVALTYSATNVSLYLDGQLATNGGRGLSIWPGPGASQNGIYFGSDTNGNYLANGLFDWVQTYGYVLDSNTDANIFDQEGLDVEIIPYNAPYMGTLTSASSTSPDPPAYNEVSGSGYLGSPVGTASTCITQQVDTVWITNVVATQVGHGTNLKMNLTFTIEGGQPGVPYDVFANTRLSFGAGGTNWAWMGQGYSCDVYTLTNLPGTTCFLILGTPQDTLGVGLTDAYQLLVTKTNPNNPSAAGDGISNGDKVAMGLNPNVAIPAIPANFTVQTCPQ